MSGIMGGIMSGIMGGIIMNFSTTTFNSSLNKMMISIMLVGGIMTGIMGGVVVVVLNKRIFWNI